MEKISFNDYPKVKLNELTFFERPTRRKWNEWVEEKDDKNIYRFYKSNSKEYFTDKYDFDWEYIILSNRWPTINFYYFDWKFWVSEMLFVFNNRTNNINLKFLYYYLISIKEEIEKLRVWVLTPILRRIDLQNIEIPLPPLETQVTIIKYLDKQFESLKNIKNNLESYQKNLLKLEDWILKYELWSNKNSNLLFNIDNISLLNKQNIFEINKIRANKKDVLKIASYLEIIQNIQNSPQKIESKKLYEILTALIVSNFLILSWPSWVGKTSLVWKISNELSWEFLKFPIKSNFSDESWLLGYWNSLLSKYEWTEVLEFIFESSQNENIPYFLLLDEMNLSRIENYFSEFLSKIDDIKSIWAEIKLFDVLIDNENKYKNIRYFKDKYGLTKNEIIVKNWDFEDIEKDYDKNHQLQIEVKINLYSNLHIVWTINEDETTFNLSNKVLDRAFYIELWVDDLFEENKNTDISKFFIDWISWFKENNNHILNLDAITDIKKRWEVYEEFFVKIVAKYWKIISNNIDENSDFFERNKNLWIIDFIQTVWNLKICYNLKYLLSRSKNHDKEINRIKKYLIETNIDYCFQVINEPDILELNENVIIVWINILDDLLSQLHKRDDNFLWNIKDINYPDITEKNKWNSDIFDNETKKFFNDLNKIIQKINPMDSIWYRAIADIWDFYENYKYFIQSHSLKTEDWDNIVLEDWSNMLLENQFNDKEVLDIVLCQKVWPKMTNYFLLWDKEEEFDKILELINDNLWEKSKSYEKIKNLINILFNN